MNNIIWQVKLIMEKKKKKAMLSAYLYLGFALFYYKFWSYCLPYKKYKCMGYWMSLNGLSYLKFLPCHSKINQVHLKKKK